jgi:hypothetical protein
MMCPNGFVYIEGNDLPMNEIEIIDGEHHMLTSTIAPFIQNMLNKLINRLKLRNVFKMMQNNINSSCTATHPRSIYDIKYEIP